MFSQLLGFEWRYHTRQISFIVAVVFASLLGALFGTALYSGAQVNINAPAHLSFVFGNFSLGAIFVLMVTCANAMLRDSDSKMSELVFATAIDKTTLLFTRFVGAFGVSAMVMAFAAIGALVGLGLPWIDPQKVGAVEPLHYLWSYLVIILPSMFFSGALIFAVAALSRSMIATYLSAVLIYILYMSLSAMGGSPMFVGGTPPSAEAYGMAARFDPFAIMTYFEQTQYWTPQQKNADLLHLEGNFLFNRLFLIALGAVLLFALHRLYTLKLPQRKPGKVEAFVKAEDVASYRTIKVSQNAKAKRAAWWSALQLELAQVVKHWPFAVMLTMFGGLVAIEMLNQLANIDYGPAYYPTTGRLINAVQFDVLPRFGIIFIIYYGAEIFWRERHVNFEAFIDSTPVNNYSLFGSKLLALISVPFAMIATTIVVAVLIQISQGYFDFQFALHLGLFYYVGLPLVFVSTMAIFVQTLAKNKYIGMALTAVVALASGPAIAGWAGFEHPLWHFTRVPVLDFTEMYGYAVGGDAFAWYMVYWGAFSACLAVIGFALWPRGTANSLKVGMGQLRGFKVPLTASAVIMIASGSYIYAKTPFISNDAYVQQRVDYERKYKQYENMSKPQATGLKATIDLYPEQRKYQLRLEYVLTNQTEQPIDQLMVSANWADLNTQIELPQGRLTQHDDELAVYFYQLNSPLLPGESVKMNVSMASEQSGFSSSSFRNTVIDNGSHLTLNSIAPMIGYRGGREVASDHLRAEHQLPPKAEPETLAEAVHRKNGDFRDEMDWIDFEAVVSTAPDQTAIIQGDLIGSWQENGRRYFHYKTDGKIRNVIALLSGRFEVKKVDHKGVSVEVYYHPSHGQNVDHMIASATHSLDYFNEHFSPYTLNHLRITEVPVGASSRMTGFATSGNMMISNYGGFTADMNSHYEVDQVYRRIAHEVAHQWWGYKLDPAYVPGSLLMVETLAKYSEMRILEERFGKQHVRDLVAYEQRRYLRGRSLQNRMEQPIYAGMGDQNHLFYSKGANAMYALTEMLGETAMNQALVAMLEQHAYPKNLPTSLDFIDVLQSVAPQSSHHKIDELLKQVVLYEFDIVSAKSTELADGQHQVDVLLRNLKYQVDGQGIQEEVALSAPVDIAIYNAYPSGKRSQTALLLHQSEVLQSGEQRLRFVVDEKPKYLRIDPDIMYIDMKRSNNLSDIK